jgi:hypothetical protein
MCLSLKVSYAKKKDMSYAKKRKRKIHAKGHEWKKWTSVQRIK